MTPSSHQDIAGKGTQKKLFMAFGLVTLVFVVLFLVILPYEFYNRDVDEARQNAQNISKLILMRPGKTLKISPSLSGPVFFPI